jgi:uncharacterized protein
MHIGGKLFFDLRTGKSRIHGKGAFASEKISARKKIGSMGGTILSKKEARMKVREQESIALVELWNGKAIDASAETTALRYINHSCIPNTYLRTFNFHVEFYALRDIEPGEELTCNYGPTHHDGKKHCTCGAAGCKGFL